MTSTAATDREQQLITELTQMGISYHLFEHQAITTMEAGAQIIAQLNELHTAVVVPVNLLLRDKAGKLYLLIKAPGKTKFNVIEKQLGTKGLKLVGMAELTELLDVPPGTATPFALVTHPEIPILWDHSITQGMIYFHPFRNTASLGVMYGELMRVFAQQQSTVTFVDC